MRSILVPLFYLWLVASIVVLARRRMNNGSFRSSPPEDQTAITAPTEPFPAPPPLAPTEVDGPSPPAPTDADEPPPRAGADADESPPPTPAESEHAEGSVAVKPAPTARSGPAAETLADALDGIAMPCELMPLITDRFDPRNVAFSTQGFDAAAVGTAVADEFEGLGYELSPIDSRTIDARRGADHIQIRLTSAALDSAAVMESRFPSANPDALVVEFRLV